MKDSWLRGLNRNIWEHPSFLFLCQSKAIAFISSLKRHLKRVLRECFIDEQKLLKEEKAPWCIHDPVKPGMVPYHLNPAFIFPVRVNCNHSILKTKVFLRARLNVKYDRNWLFMTMHMYGGTQVTPTPQIKSDYNGFLFSLCSVPSEERARVSAWTSSHKMRDSHVIDKIAVLLRTGSSCCWRVAPPIPAPVPRWSADECSLSLSVQSELPSLR